MLEKIFRRIYDTRRRLFGKYIVQDPQPTAASAPYTYYLPPTDFLAAIAPGDVVKIVFESVPPSKKHEAERMWVIVTERDGDKLLGKLDNDPFDIPQLKSGTPVEFSIEDIIDIDWDDDALLKRGLTRKSSRQYWDRCMVDSVVVNESIPVQYIYREEPDLGGDKDKYPDSGWRIRGNVELMTDEQYENESAEYIAIGKVLNVDDSWIHLIDEPIGARFFKNPDTEEFEITTKD